MYGKQKTRKRQSAAFSLIEALIASMLIGLVVTSLAVSSGAYTQANAAGLDIANAEFLIEEIRELTAPLPVADPQDGAGSYFGHEAGESYSFYDDLDDFAYKYCYPPIDAGGTAMTEFSNYAQYIHLENVSGSNFTSTVGNHDSNFYRVTVYIYKNHQPLTSASWIRTRID